jgi:hypothetical protein
LIGYNESQNRNKKLFLLDLYEMTLDTDELQSRRIGEFCVGEDFKDALYMKVSWF